SSDLDWLPFREVTARTGAAMMLSHVRLPDIDPDAPASLSRKLVQDVLRKGWNYQGILMTDDLNMGTVYATGIGQAAAAALDAGVDLVLVTYDPDQYYRALYAAAKAWRGGRIDAGREAESARRLDGYWQKNRAQSAVQTAGLASRDERRR
ncbi:MAG: glycoside hydrolase family 3 protein, partial [Candidatus Accumulibacter sp.]|nr:glycoside hydrolase family 3 protein [Accumulibacter sp.]